MNIQLANGDQDIHNACHVLQQLRPQYALEVLVDTVKKQQQEGYQVVLASENDDCLGVAGFVIGHKLAWKKHLYIDDLIVAEDARSAGVGGALLDWICRFAQDEACEQIHLDSGVQRFAAHKFYLNHGFKIASHHFSREINPQS